MYTEDIVCPSGFACTIRELQVREEDLIANPKNRRGNKVVSKLLDSVTTQVTDWSIYKPTEGGKVNWDKLLLGDRFYMLYRIRMLSYGEEYDFSFNCPECSKKCNATLDLSTLEMKRLSDESKKILSEGGLFETTLPRCGKKVKFRLLVGSDEKNIQTLTTKNKENISTSILNYRVMEVDDVKFTNKVEFLRSLGSRDATFLRKEFDRVDCGIETGINLECIHCFSEVELDVKFDENFFFPK